MFASFSKLCHYLEDISEQWTGHCHACDENTIYSIGLPAYKELLHLKTVHWHQTVKGRTISVATAPSVSNPLRPWISKPSLKSSTENSELLSVQSLLSNYKCMAANCAYYTSDETSMENHLNHHADSRNESSTFIECCYCPKEFEATEEYFTHIKALHGYSQYYCPYCFYRSNYYNAHHHVTVYHPDRQRFVLDGKFDGLFTGVTIDSDDMYDQVTNNVKPSECQGIK